MKKYTYTKENYFADLIQGLDPKIQSKGKKIDPKIEPLIFGGGSKGGVGSVKSKRIGIAPRYINRGKDWYSR